jgi:hypothetical protein
MPILIPLKVLIPVGLITIILIVISWVFYSKNKKLYQKIVLEKNKIRFYKKQLNDIKISNENPERKFERLNNLSRAFFKEYHNLGYNLTYLELSKNFAKQNKLEHSDLTKLMSDIRYSGKEISVSQIQEIINQLNKIIELE